jgi:hypothetical protein
VSKTQTKSKEIDNDGTRKDDFVGIAESDTRRIESEKT